MEREFYCRTRRFERKVGDAEPYQVYWMAVKGDGGWSVLAVTDKVLSPQLLMTFLPKSGESSIVEPISKNLGLEEALSFLDTKEREMAGRKNTSIVEDDGTIGGWHYLSFAGRHRVKFTTGFQTRHPDLYRSMMSGRFPITLEHLTLPINGPIFSNDDEGLLLTPVYHSQFSDGWVLYARAVRAANLWQVQEIQRQITTGLPPSAAPVEKIRNLGPDAKGDFFSVIRALSDWEDVQALTPGTRFFGPEDLSEEQKQKLQMLALRGSYFRVAAERDSLVFDVFGRPHLSAGGVPMGEGVFPRLNPEKPEFPSLQRLLGYIESSGPQEESPPSLPSSQEDVLSPDGITKALAFYLDHFMVQSGLSMHKWPRELRRLDTDWLQVTRDFLRKLNIELPHPQASALTVAADFLTEQGNEFVRAAAREEAYRLQWRQRLESEQEVHLNRMGKVQSEIAELEARSKALAEKLAEQTSALEELSRKTAEEQVNLQNLQEQQEALKTSIRDAAIKEAEAAANAKARELQKAMIDFRNATLPPETGNAQPFISLRLEFNRLNTVEALALCRVFSDVPEKGIKIRIETQGYTSTLTPEYRLASVHENLDWFKKRNIEEELEKKYTLRLWIEGTKGDVVHFVKPQGPLKRQLQELVFRVQKFPFYNIRSIVQINETEAMAHFSGACVPASLAKDVRTYTPFSDSHIAAQLAEPHASVK